MSDFAVRMSVILGPGCDFAIWKRILLYQVYDIIEGGIAGLDE
jgi:hypothetical protein